MHHPTDRITHTTAFVTPVVEHWLSVLDIDNKKTEQKNHYTLVLFMVNFSLTIILYLKMKLFFTTTLKFQNCSEF